MRRNDAGFIAHRIRILKEQKSRLQQEFDEARNRFVELCLGHGLAPGIVPAKIPNYAVRANRLRCGIWSSAVLATFVFGILNALTIEAASGPVVFLGSLVFAVLVGYFASSVLSRWLDVDIMEPESTKAADILHNTSGAVAIVSFVIFLALRFWESSTARSSLPVLATLFEFSLLVALASAREILPAYSWAEEYANKCDRVQRKVEILNQRIESCKRYLTEEDHENDREKNDRDDSTGPRTPSANDVPGKRPKPNGSAADHPDID